jgi:hypothetical protein
MSIARLSLAAACVLALWLAPVGAQIGLPCGQDDGFRVGPCCAPVQITNLPQFPTLTSQGTYGCILNCALDAQFSQTVVVGAPIFVTCDLALLPVTCLPASPGAPGFVAAPVAPGLPPGLLAKYSRTWIEIDATGTQRQVWRFLLNGDVSYMSVTAVGSPCPIPPCHMPPLSLPVHMVGSIDYARDCTTTVPPTAPFQIALNLTHFDGCLNHAPFSARPLAGGAHPAREYALIAPANFVFGLSPEPAGPIVAEATRTSAIAAAGYVCFSEAQIQQGQLLTQFTNCQTDTCIPTPVINPPLWYHQALNGFTACNGAAFPFNTLPAPPVFPTGLMGLSLGAYVPAAVIGFPGGRSVISYYGVVNYPDPCNTYPFPFHVVNGVGNVLQTATIQLFGAPSPATLNEMLDLQDSLLLQNGLSLGIGAPFFAPIVWNINTL